jgi:hypothetical protein
MQNIPNGHRVYQHLLMQDTPKFIQIGIFGLKNMPSGNPEDFIFWQIQHFLIISDLFTTKI